MTKDEIKKALEICCTDYSCDNCPYEVEDVRNCSDTLKLDARTCIIKQEQEIDRLKVDYSKLQEQFANYQLASGKEIMAQVKQAKFDVLDELKPLLEGYIHKTTGESLYVYTCKKFNIEVQNAEDKD